MTRQPQRMFLSYSRSNRRVCRTLFHILRDAGHEVWWDERRLYGGDFIWDNIFAQISQATSFVVLLSPKALESEYVGLEVELARELLEKDRLGRFLPIKVRPCRAEADSRFSEHVILDGTSGIRRIGSRILQALPDKPHTPSAAEDITPDTYFDLILPSMLRWYGDEATKLDASVYFNLYDAGDSKWTVVLREPEPRVLHGKVGSPDLDIHIKAAEMTNMLTGFFDARNAIAKGSLHLAGRLDLLGGFGRLLSGKKA